MNIKISIAIAYCLISTARAATPETAPSLRHDPFVQIVRAKPSQLTKEKEVLPSLTLNATLLSDETPMAIINNEVMGIGEKIAGFKLISIRQGSTTLARNTKKVTLNVNKPEQSDE